MGTNLMHELQPFFDEDSWSLFRHIAFSGKREYCIELEDIGKEIAKRCEGVPLILKRIGNAMRFRRERREWELVLKSETWDLSIITRGIVLELQLSYNNMPSYLKQCFAFCSIFPRDHVIEKEMLIKLWMAQDFIALEGNEEMEIAGERYFNDLLRRSLFQGQTTDERGNAMHWKMNDIVHELFQTVMIESYIMRRQTANISTHARHFSLICDDNLASMPPALYKAKYARTLLLIGWSRITDIPRDLFENLRFLRALDLSGITMITRLPNSLKHLKLLKYLNLSTTKIEKLPESLSRLYLLQTLKLNECQMLQKLPKEIRMLTKLRHLEIKGTWMLNFLPEGIGRLCSLRTLSKFIIRDAVGCMIGELKGLNLLHGELAIHHLERVSGEDEAKEASLESKQHLHALELSCGDESNSDHRVLGYLELQRMHRVFEGLRPHTNLRDLKIVRYFGNKFPSWMDNSLLSNLINVSLCECYNCSFLPPLGKLPFLKHLTIEGMDEVKYAGDRFCGKDYIGVGSRDVHTRSAAASTSTVNQVFPKLETLIFARMCSLERCDLAPEDGDMPSLLELHIEDCPKLRVLPRYLPDTLWKLNIDCGEELSIVQCLPPSLECLVIKNNIEKLWPLPSLPVLKNLTVENSHLSSLPDGLIGLKALKTIEIRGCPELASLPEELRYLTTLRQLRIKDCPYLESSFRCGQLQMISHIPNVWIDNEKIR